MPINTQPVEVKTPTTTTIIADKLYVDMIVIDSSDRTNPPKISVTQTPYRQNDDGTRTFANESFTIKSDNAYALGGVVPAIGLVEYAIFAGLPDLNARVADNATALATALERQTTNVAAAESAATAALSEVTSTTTTSLAKAQADATAASEAATTAAEAAVTVAQTAVTTTSATLEALTTARNAAFVAKGVLNADDPDLPAAVAAWELADAAYHPAAAAATAAAVNLNTVQATAKADIEAARVAGIANVNAIRTAGETAVAAEQAAGEARVNIVRATEAARVAIAQAAVADVANPPLT